MADEVVYASVLQKSLWYRNRVGIDGRHVFKSLAFLFVLKSQAVTVLGEHALY